MASCFAAKALCKASSCVFQSSLPAVLEVSCLTLPPESNNCSADLDSAPVRLKPSVPLVSEATASNPEPTETVDGCHSVDSALLEPVPLMARGAVTVMVSILLTMSFVRATWDVFQTSAPVWLAVRS